MEVNGSTWFHLQLYADFGMNPIFNMILTELKESSKMNLMLDLRRQSDCCKYPFRYEGREHSV